MSTTRIPADAAKYVIMRKAVLMEDEGLESLVRVCDTLAVAREWVAAQKGQYFRPEDYYIMKTVE